MNKTEGLENIYFDFSQQDSISSYLNNVFSSNGNIPDMIPSQPNPMQSLPNENLKVKLESTNEPIKMDKGTNKNIANEIQQRFMVSKNCNQNECLSILPVLPESVQQYCDITEYLNLPQNQAAKKLRIPPSTLSKRWKEASRNRKWPWRSVRKIDKEITCLLHNIPTNGSMPEEVENHLSILLKKRQDELRPVVIRI